MTDEPVPPPRLLAVSDLHVGYADNRPHVDALRPASPGDWLIVAGDVCETVEDLRRTLGGLRERFATVVWTPGNHELWTHPSDPVTLRGVERYEHLIEAARALGVVTPEDPYPVFTGPGGPVRVAPLMLLYDYSFRAPGTTTTEQSLAVARAAGVYARDEFLLHPDPYAGRSEWCRARVRATEVRLAGCDPDVPLVLVNHWPLLRAPTRILRHQEFAQWCGTELTADWHVRFRTAAAVYGHLHVPRTTVHDGVPFHEVSLGYPREWRRRGATAYRPRDVLGAT
ncbi:MAG: metallophosphoesterase family protein [Kineosporiaceae bacterium]